MLKILSAVSCLRNGSSRARSLFPLETSRKGRNSPPESLHGNIWENVLSNSTYSKTRVVNKQNTQERIFYKQHLHNEHFLSNSQGFMVLQLGVDVLHFCLRLLPQPPFFCFRQDCGFHPLRLFDLQQNYKQLQGRTVVMLSVEWRSKRHLAASKHVTSRHLFYFAEDF